jgi:hypothetical protein
LGERTECDCDDGFSVVDHVLCVDIDECAVDNGGCDRLTECTNAEGSRSCSPCPPGYDGDGGAGCVAIACGDGIAGVDCPCLWVQPDGDDDEAAANLGRTPFRNVQPAIDFADDNSAIARHVCVVGGATCQELVSYADASGGLTMRNGVSVHGSYLAGTRTPCDGINTELVLASALGVQFGEAIEEPTVLEYFRLVRHLASRSVGVSAAGSRNARLSVLSITGAFDSPELVGVDVSAGATVALDHVSTADADEMGRPLAAAGNVTGLRVVDSRVSSVGSRFNALVGTGSAIGVSFESAAGSTFDGGAARLRSLQSTASSLVGVRIRGNAEDIDIEDNTVELGWEYGDAAVLRGIDIEGNGQVSVLGNTIRLERATGEMIGVRAVEASVELSGSVRTAGGSSAHGVWFDGAPGSNLGGTVEVVALSGLPTTGTGARIGGDAAGTRVTVDINVSGPVSQPVGLLFEACAGASPVVSGSRVTVSTSAAGVNLEAIRSFGDCHPRIESNALIAAVGTRGTTTTGIRCGMGSRCVIADNADIHTENTNITPGTQGPSTGVACETGGCATIANNTIEGLTPVQSCFRSCYYEASGVSLSATDALVEGNRISAGCADRAIGIRAGSGTTSRLANNTVTGRPSSCMPISDNLLEIYGLYSSTLLEVDSNSFSAGMTSMAAITCTSAGVRVSGGVFRNNVFSAGECDSRADFWEDVPPTVLERNVFVPGSVLYLAGGLVPLTIDQINALPGASENVSN